MNRHRQLRYRILHSRGVMGGSGMTAATAKIQSRSSGVLRTIRRTGFHGPGDNPFHLPGVIRDLGHGPAHRTHPGERRRQEVRREPQLPLTDRAALDQRVFASSKTRQRTFPSS